MNWRKHAIPHTPYVLSELELCYAAALLEGLRLIEAKAHARHVSITLSGNAIALADFVQSMGDRLVHLHGLDRGKAL